MEKSIPEELLKGIKRAKIGGREKREEEGRGRKKKMDDGGRGE
jgi:hypothetical protein